MGGLLCDGQRFEERGEEGSLLLVGWVWVSTGVDTHTARARMATRATDALARRDTHDIRSARSGFISLGGGR